MRFNTKIRSDQQGFAAIVVAVVLVLVLSLITIGFAELMRHEQRSALDKQLNSQAYYAAESGVNDAVKAINAGFDIAKTDCAPFQSKPSGLDDIQHPHNDSWEYLDKASGSNKVGTDASTNVVYSCLLIDPLPPTIEYSSVGTEQPRVTEITSADKDRNINKLVISWQSADDSANFRPGACSGNNCFPPAGAGSGHWGDKTTSVLQVNLTPGNELSRSNFINNTFTAFLYPNKDAGSTINSVAYTDNAGHPEQEAPIVNGNCGQDKAPRFCNVVITGLNARTYFLSVRSMPYNSSRVTIAAYDGPIDEPSHQLRIRNAQILIDSTGKAEDVLKRIQVRVPVKNNYDHSPFGIEAGGGGNSICKQLQIYPTFAGQPNDSYSGC